MGLGDMQQGDCLLCIDLNKALAGKYGSKDGFQMIDGLGFCVIYRARIHSDKEAKYIAAWSRLTRLIRSERGGLGSRLHRGSDGIWYAYAQWASAEARAAAFNLPSVDPVAQADVVDSIIEYFPEIVLDPVEDQLVPMSELALGDSIKSIRRDAQSFASRDTD